MLKLLGLIGLLGIFVLGAMLIDELRKIRRLLARKLGNLAEASWRIREELSALNQGKENGEKLIPPQK
jgi:hypothetical protein